MPRCEICFKKSDKRVRIGKREGPQQYCIHDTEDRGVGADTERERDSCDDADARRFEQHAQSEADVL